MNIVNEIKMEVMEYIQEYKNTSSDHYDFWEEHIKYVYKEAALLAKEYGANIEIVKLGALLHDIALIKNVRDKSDHHINGKIIADEILSKYNYPNDLKEKVLSCVFNHRSSKNSKSLEELCVADADILAHFDNIPMLFNCAFNRCNVNLNEVRRWMMDCFTKDYNDLSDKTKETFKENYENIIRVVIGE